MIKNLFMLFLTIILVGTATGCKKEDVAANVPDTTVSEVETSIAQPVTVEDEELQESYFVTGENYFDYQTGLECAAFSSAYILRHYGEEADAMELFETFPNKIPSGGVFPRGIVNFFNDRGYEAEFRENGTIEELKKELCNGSPVIAFIHVSEPYESVHNTHYVPLVGYDEEYFYFAESLSDFANCQDEKGVSYNRKTDYEKFSRLWTNIDGYWENPYFVIENPE